MMRLSLEKKLISSILKHMTFSWNQLTAEENGSSHIIIQSSPARPTSRRIPVGKFIYHASNSSVKAANENIK